MKNTDLHVKILLKILVLENKYKIVWPLYAAPNKGTTIFN